MSSIPMPAAPAADSRRAALTALLLAPLVAAVPAGVAAQSSKPNRDETIAYINNVLRKTLGAAITHTQFGRLHITELQLAYEPGTQTYRTRTVETLESRIEQWQVRVVNNTLRTRWNMRDAVAVEELGVTESRGGVDVPSTELRRVRVKFRSASVRNQATQQIYRNGVFNSGKTLLDETIDFVSFFYLAAHPDDGKRLRNALLRLKELDEEVRDPFLN
jgi:hypothetical protein